jgi:fructose-bisphosphate aldolase, class II
MRTLQEVIRDAEAKGVAVGHFNIANIATLKAISEATKELNVPVIIGTSEGESKYVDVHRAVAMVRDLRENHGVECFLNADHTHSLDKIKEAVKAGYDAVLFDGGKLTIEENIKQTKEVVDHVKSINSNILVEGELGYIGSSSKILKEIPEGAAINEGDLTEAEEARQFVEETKIDFLAPAVGNIHGMFKGAPNPNLNINRIKQIKESAKVPLVLHGGSGIRDEDFESAIRAGISIIHINTEVRVAWRHGLETSLKGKPDEVSPYKLIEEALDGMTRVVYNRLKLFNRM